MQDVLQEIKFLKVLLDVTTKGAFQYIAEKVFDYEIV
jgi:hypothetical protein